MDSAMWLSLTNEMSGNVQSNISEKTSAYSTKDKKAFYL